LQVAGRTYW